MTRFKFRANYSSCYKASKLFTYKTTKTKTNNFKVKARNCVFFIIYFEFCSLWYVCDRRTSLPLYRNLLNYKNSPQITLFLDEFWKTLHTNGKILKKKNKYLKKLHFNRCAVIVQCTLFNSLKPTDFLWAVDSTKSPSLYYHEEKSQRLHYECRRNAFLLWFVLFILRLYRFVWAGFTCVYSRFIHAHVQLL